MFLSKFLKKTSMGSSNKKEKLEEVVGTKQNPLLIENEDETLFKIATPRGYFIPQVNKAFKHLQDIIEQQNDAMRTLQQHNLLLQQENSDFQNEIQRLHLQRDAAAIPDMDEQQTNEVYKEFISQTNAPILDTADTIDQQIQDIAKDSQQQDEKDSSSPPLLQTFPVVSDKGIVSQDPTKPTKYGTYALKSKDFNLTVVGDMSDE